ncbi:MAG: SpvB/TcaC N-terminal domain-containing protein, partial [Candidatus Kariarchaeaceae archaeon]
MDEMNRRDFLELSAKSAATAAIGSSIVSPFVANDSAQASEGISSSSASAISLPKGGGAISGIGETFQPNLFTGTGNFSVPIATTPGRNGLGPKLSLQYSTGNGNSIFGMGWQLSIPRITRKTERGLPLYNAEDVFVMSGAEDLVRVLDDTGNPVIIPDPKYTIERFRPPTEGLFAWIERWANKTERTDTFWRAVTKENITSIFGRSPLSRISKPDYDEKIYEWLLEESFDVKGNHIYYEYAQEEPDDKTRNQMYERNRQYNQRYIRRILYGNCPDALVENTAEKLWPSKGGTDHRDLKSKKTRY